ncbi:MAG: MarR family transcriptional regulator [Candidatus Omnitrophica bacterium]|nr:MarR family transcriptional regulator [Candidatus Omnitrophota bacterium]
MSVSLVDFADKLHEVMPVVMREFTHRQVDELRSGKITLSQFLILDFLQRYSAARMTDLARFMQVSTAAMTGLVERLVNYGYAARVLNPNDRRIVKVQLTPKGTEIVKKIYQSRRKMIMDIFGKITHRERQEYLNVLLHIKEIITEDKGKK